MDLSAFCKIVVPATITEVVVEMMRELNFLTNFELQSLYISVHFCTFLYISVSTLMEIILVFNRA